MVSAVEKPTRFPTSAYAVSDKDTSTTESTTSTSTSYSHLYSLRSLLVNIILPSFGAIIILFVLVYWFFYRHLPEDDEDALFRLKSRDSYVKVVDKQDQYPVATVHLKR